MVRSVQGSRPRFGTGSSRRGEFRFCRNPSRTAGHVASHGVSQVTSREVNQRVNIDAGTGEVRPGGSTVRVR